jgi:hypothetical protein
VLVQGSITDKNRDAPPESAFLTDLSRSLLSQGTAGPLLPALTVDIPEDLVALTDGFALSSPEVPADLYVGGIETELEAEAAFLRGDANDDGKVDIGDPIYALGFLFLGGPAIPCPDAADSNDDGTLAIGDPIHLLTYIFLGGEPPAFPGPLECGPDSVPDSFEACEAAACRQ